MWLRVSVNVVVAMPVAFGIEEGVVVVGVSFGRLVRILMYVRI